MVKKIEFYNENIKVILQNSDLSPINYFYTDNTPEAIELVKKYDWFIYPYGDSNYVVAEFNGELIPFELEYAIKLLGFPPYTIIHINRVEIDCRKSNMQFFIGS